MRVVVAALCLLYAIPVLAQLPATGLPDAPSQILLATMVPGDLGVSSSSAGANPFDYSFYPQGHEPRDSTQNQAQAAKNSDRPRPEQKVDLDADGNPIPISRQQPQRILGIMPNFRSVSGGAVPPPPSFKTNFKIATHQALDYSTFIFLGLTSVTAEGMDAHPALGNEHSVPIRVLYVISRQAVARTYEGRQTPNIAGLGGKVITQIVSREYYPSSTTDFAALATKFGYSVMRDVAFSSVREFYPDIAAHYIANTMKKLWPSQRAT